MHPSMQRYAGNPMMRFQSDENDDGCGPEQPHTYPGGDAQHPPIFVVPQPVRTRRPGPSRPIQLGRRAASPPRPCATTSTA
ncbi:hypothetical protein DIPPA_18777 [Diplonema papillatum]|nr:hypothetical protein DIPPA_18777 [Diplonema papillatum]